jgi:hypothetical protein
MIRPVLALLFLLPAAALAAPPDACTLLTPDEINRVADRLVERVQPQKSGNPSQCGFLDARRSAVVVLTVREVQYAVKEEIAIERDNLEKIYRSSSKKLESVGDAGFWQPANKQMTFHRKNLIVSLIFSTPKNQNELDTAILARLVEARLPK